MGFKCGIVGLPNVGKSTLFNTLTLASIAAENYPFCTIEPNLGMVAVPDSRLHKIAEIVQSKEVIPTTLEFVDIAGLVKGASKGEGLGNQFLEHIRRTHAIAHIVRCFDNDKVTHIEGKVDPVSDIETIHTELSLADLTVVESVLFRSEKMAKARDKKAVSYMQSMHKIYDCLAQGNNLRDMDWDTETQIVLRGLNLLTAKPMILVANTDEKGLHDNQYLDVVQQYASSKQLEVFPICAAMEAELLDLDEEERYVFLQDMGLSKPGLERIIEAGYRLLDLLTFFTAGPKEVRAWTTRQGSYAPQAAGCIHTDFEKGFIRAEVIAYEDYIAHNGEQSAKEAGKLRLEGKDYLVTEGDVMHFRFNV